MSNDSKPPMVDDEYYIDPACIIDSSRILVEKRNGISEIAHFDDSTDQWHLEYLAHDIEPELDWINALSTEGNNGYNADRTWWHVGEVPYIVKLQWDKELGDDCMKKEYNDWIVRKLNDGDFSKLRVGRGRI